MEYSKVASVNDLKPGEKIRVFLGGEPILLANVENEYYAISDKCTHRGCMLSDGIFDGSTIRCVCHGSKFDLKTGKVVKGPADKPEPTYQVRIQGDQIQVEK